MLTDVFEKVSPGYYVGIPMPSSDAWQASAEAAKPRSKRTKFLSDEQADKIKAMSKPSDTWRNLTALS